MTPSEKRIAVLICQAIMWTIFVLGVGFFAFSANRTLGAIDPKPSYRDLGVEWVKCIDRKKRVRHGDCVREHRKW